MVLTLNTRFSPSLNGSLHLGHMAMAWINRTYAHMHGGEFILRFDDVAPRVAGEDVTQMSQWASEAEEFLRLAGLAPDRISYLSNFAEPDESFLELAGGRNLWYRASDLEGHFNLACCPPLVQVRVRADIAECIGIVIRGEELLAELQLYEYFNSLLGGETRELVFLPRLRVRHGDEVSTISKTVGNLQLRDLFEIDSPENWLERVRCAVLLNQTKPLAWHNLNPDPIIQIM